jgi:hypothetical protein
LQSDPMQTNRQTKCADRRDPASAAKHDCEVNPPACSMSISARDANFQAAPKYSRRSAA